MTHKKYSERIVWAVAECSAAEIDASNILQASLSAMARAVWDLKIPEAGLRTYTTCKSKCNNFFFPFYYTVRVFLYSFLLFNAFPLH